MLTYILVNKICNLAKKMKLWNSPQRLQEEVEYLLGNEQVEYEKVVVFGNIKTSSIFVIQNLYVDLVSPNCLIESCIEQYKMENYEFEIISEQYARFKNTKKPSSRLNIPKILLINVCNASLRPIPRLNLSTATIGSYLRLKGAAEVCILDMQFGLTIETVIEEVKQFAPIIVGISIDFLEYGIGMRIIDAIENLNKHIYIVLGNVLPALLPEKFLECHPNVLISYGEGEKSLYDIACWAQGNLSIKDVSGIIYRLENRMVKNEIQYIDMAECQTPALDTAILLKKYRGVLTLETSRGCDYSGCTFCPREHKTRFWRCLSAKQVIEQINDLLQVAEELELPKHIYFADEEMIGELQNGAELDRMIEICEEIIEKHKNLKLDIAVRADSIYNPHKGKEYNIKMLKMWKLIKQAGADRIFVGVESGCEKQLKRYNKGTVPMQNVIAIRILTAIGMQVRLGFVMFDPLMPDIKELQENIEFLERTDAVLRPIISDESDEKILLQIESDEKWIQEQKAGIALYNYVSYLMTGLEVFVNAPYAKMVRLYERETNQSLVYGYDWELGKLLVHYIVPRIERIYQICNMCVQKNYGVTYTLKSLLKSANGIQKEFLRNEMYKYRKMIFEFAKEIINICEYMEQIEENKYFTNIYEEWMEHKVKPYILELLAAVNAGVVSDTENKLFTNVLNEWLETSYDIVNT